VPATVKVVQIDRKRAGNCCEAAFVVWTPPFQRGIRLIRSEENCLLFPVATDKFPVFDLTGNFLQAIETRLKFNRNSIQEQGKRRENLQIPCSQGISGDERKTRRVG
jgi:hypothetical protein